MLYAIVGLQWGDEGKGKIIDYMISNNMKRDGYVVRFNGGANAGHRVVFDGKTVKNHLLPGGVCRSMNSVIGPSVHFNPESFFNEIDVLNAQGISVDPKKIFIDELAPVVFPWHLQLDGYKEETRKEGKIGTTKQGIGPMAMDLAERTPVIHVQDLISGNYRKRIEDVVHDKATELMKANAIIVPSHDHFWIMAERLLIESLVKEKNAFNSNIESMMSEYIERIQIDNAIIKQRIDEYVSTITAKYEEFANRLKEFSIVSASDLVYNAHRAGKDVLFEGAQGVLLDNILGTGPFVTSSRTVGTIAGADFGINERIPTIGVLKAYPTRVGGGPFPSEIDHECELSRQILQDGEEYGTTTGRPRYPGFPDMVALNYAIQISGVTNIALTKIDILAGKLNLEGELNLKYVNRYHYTDLDETSTQFHPARLSSVEVREEDCKPLAPIEAIVKETGEDIISRNPEQYKNAHPKKYPITPYDELRSGTLPKGWQSFMDTIENISKKHGVFLSHLSFGPDTKDTIEL